MSIFWIVFLTIYGGGLFVFWMCVFADGADNVRRHFGKHDYLSRYGREKITKEEWFKIIWISLFWPIIYLYMFFRYWLVACLKILVGFIIYPFKELIKAIPKKRK